VISNGASTLMCNETAFKKFSPGFLEEANADDDDDVSIEDF
jgi:hypothetical protein